MKPFNLEEALAGKPVNIDGRIKVGSSPYDSEKKAREASGSDCIATVPIEFEV